MQGIISHHFVDSKPPMKPPSALTALFLCLSSAPSWAQTLPAVVKGEVPDLVETYKGIHSHPELSHHEEHTSALLAGFGEFFLGKNADSGPVFIPLVIMGLILTIFQTYLIYRYFVPPKKPPQSPFLLSQQSENLGDVCLFLNMILFQVGWNMLTFVDLGHPKNLLDFGGRLFFLSFIALLIYFPPRMFYLAEDIHRRRTWATMLLANSPVIARVLIGTGSNTTGW